MSACRSRTPRHIAHLRASWTPSPTLPPLLLGRLIRSHQLVGLRPDTGATRLRTVCPLRRTSSWIETGTSHADLWTANKGAPARVCVGVTATFSATLGVASIRVPNQFNSVSVVRASSGAVLATLTDNDLNGLTSAVSDGQRILVTNLNGNSVSLWKAADLSPLGSFGTGAGTAPVDACSDGINFWIVLLTGKLPRF